MTKSTQWPVKKRGEKEHSGTVFKIGNGIQDWQDEKHF